MKTWLPSFIILLVLGAGFLPLGMKGYVYITGALWLAALCVLVANVASDGLKRVFCVLLCLGLIYFGLCEILITGSAKTSRDLPKSHVVVLGAGVCGTEPTLSLIHRMQAAEEYLNAYPETKAVLSGGQGNGEDISEAECMFNWLTERGIAPERLITEDKSTSTIENLEFSAKLIEQDGGRLDDAAILSSPYHLYRAKVMAKSLGYTDPAGVACVHGYPVYSLGMYIREAFGITHLWVFGD